MRRLALLLGFALALSVGAGSGGADIGSVSTVGIDVALNLDQNQPATIGDFTGKVGWALFSQGKGVGFSHFESDMRFEQGTARNPVTAADAFGQWGFT